MTDRLHSFTLGDVVRENARSLPRVDALVCGDHRATYPQVAVRVDRTVAHLASLGVTRGDRVAWTGQNCHRLIETVFACAKLGAIAAPVNWRSTPAELERLIGDIAPRVVVVSGAEEWADATAAAAAAAPHAALVVHDDPAHEEQLAALAPLDAQGDVDDELPVLQIMTAAFQGTPKGALLSSRGIVTQDLVLPGVGLVEPGEEVYLGAGPMFHIGVLLKTFSIFHWGGTNVVIDRVDAEAVCRLIDAERCTSSFLFPPTIRQVVELAGGGRFDLSSLRDNVALPPDDVADEWYRLTSCRPPAAPGATGYGTTETVGMVTFEGRRPRGRSPFGRPSPAVALRILDPEGEEVPTGEIGEIAVRGPQVMVGYLGHEPLDPDGWRRTGDLGRREDDGSVTFLGPNQDMIKSAMENVYPVEVETALRDHDEVADACVIGVPDPDWGQSVLAVVERVDDGTVDEEELIAFVRTRISSYKKPRRVVFTDALPRTGTFVDRAAVKAAHGQPISW